PVLEALRILGAEDGEVGVERFEGARVLRDVARGEGLERATVVRRELEEDAVAWLHEFRRRGRVRVREVRHTCARVDAADCGEEAVLDDERLVAVGERRALRAAAPRLRVVAPEEVGAGRAAKALRQLRRVLGRDLERRLRLDAEIRIGRALALLVLAEERRVLREEVARDEVAERVQLVLDLEA